MDELRAYEVLKLKPGCSREEIKEAYAVLSKQFHPEEFPEEFQKIHTAYTTLIRGGRRNRRTEERPVFSEPEKPVFEENRNTAFFENEEPMVFSEEEPVRTPGKQSEEPKEAEASQSYNFDETLEQAYKTEQQELHERTLEAIAEFKILLSPAYCQKVRLFEAFFKKEEYQKVFANPVFVKALAELLEDTNLKKAIYQNIIDVYRLRDKKTENLIPEGRALYMVLDEKCPIKKKNNAKNIGIFVGVSAGIFSALRPLIRMSDMLTALAVLGVLILLLALLYHKIYENHSGIFAQFIVILAFNVIQFAAIMTDLWAPLFGSVDNGIVFSVVIMMLSWGWLIGLVIAVIVKTIKRLRKRHEKAKRQSGTIYNK
ncbi:MAG: DnaJ domain-containing protein [Ruminococcus sp.]|nr:DnaJ domain-containing protein [Ruminococcus sp.]